MAEEREIGGEVGAAQQLQSREEYLRKCDFSRLTAREWRRIGPHTLGVILTHRPELYETCRNSIKLLPESWAELLQVRPELAAACDCWGNFSAVELVRLLKKQPQLARHVLNWQALNESAWALLLLFRPELEEYCPYWIDFHLAAPWIGESVMAAHSENVKQLQRNVPWIPATTAKNLI